MRENPVVESEPPRRPRRFELDAVLVVMAMVVLVAFVMLVVAVNHWEDEVPWAYQLMVNNPDTVGYWFPGTALVLLGLSLFVRWRRRPAR